MLLLNRLMASDFLKLLVTDSLLSVMSRHCGGPQWCGLRMCHPRGGSEGFKVTFGCAGAGGGAGLAELGSTECPSGLQHLAAPSVCGALRQRGNPAPPWEMGRQNPQPACTHIPSPALSVEPFLGR